MRRFVHEITQEDVGNSSYTAPKKTCPCCGQVERQHLMAFSCLGRVLPGDVGKRIYLVGDVYQVENDWQRDARLLKGQS